MSEYIDIQSRTIRLWADNEEELNSQIIEAINESLRWDFGYVDLDADTYRYLYRNRRDEIVHHIARTVMDKVYDYAVEDLPAGLGRSLLADFLDYGNAALWEDVAEAYVPDPDDYEASI